MKSLSAAPLWLDPIPHPLRSAAIRELESGDVTGFLGNAPNTDALELVLRNLAYLRAAGLYEQALLRGYVGTRTNYSNWPLAVLRSLFEVADRERLLAAGDPLPAGDTFTLFRGVAGRGPARRVRGLSWTASREQADWFARRAGLWGLADPGTYRVTVDRQHICARISERSEDEFVVLVPPGTRAQRQ